MFKRTVTPLAKDKPLSNQPKILKDIKITATNKPILSRNPSFNKITFHQNQSIPIQGVNPESPYQIR